MLADDVEAALSDIDTDGEDLPPDTWPWLATLIEARLPGTNAWIRDRPLLSLFGTRTITIERIELSNGVPRIHRVIVLWSRAQASMVIHDPSTDGDPMRAVKKKAPRNR